MRRENSQTHTLAYKVGGKWYTRKQAVRLAKQGKISDVTVCGIGHTQHLRGINGLKLYDLKKQLV